ncbi:topoisomerase IV [Neobittarella massiliensis]|uniref:Topoisomerase IV n=1 Tax=Neobittarella massiliensis (ex Bilen et al. 2018) TaxID=2041842 RepID=A0A8J6LZA3_9FIRM|nr:DNA topoisomerase (ATP-hydrolyzing) subunit A [Neobittarella massiliensis]MBC3516527.1 topoisomerase IV [Neobittarella massiliensis]
MAPRKKKEPTVKKQVNPNAEIAGAGIVVEQPIVQTLEENYMPYAMSVIVSRALPEIDGFKPAHRKILYTMYKMGLLKGPRSKSANIVGSTMKLNPHGDAAIYETMVRLSRGNQTLLHPYVDSKGNFGKGYSRDMSYAASRYTEAKLDDICGELFRDIDKDTVDFIDNYDSTTKEPTLLPVTFPTILTNSTIGIAVGMASAICSFNLKEVCDTTIGLIKDPDFDIAGTLKAPDFAIGGIYLYDEQEMKRVIDTGRGSLKIRARYRYDEKENCIEITEIPPTTTVEAIIDKIVDLTKQGKVRELNDVRDETDLSGLKITLDLKRRVDPDKLMAKLLRMTPLQDNFSCNFNVLIAGSPRVMGVRELLGEWIAFRRECVKRRIYFDLKKKKDRLHLLLGLSKILLDIDKAVAIVRETEEEQEVVPNLMIGFGIDKIQAEYVAEIKLRHLNREYIIGRTSEKDQLQDEIARMEEILKSAKKLDKIIIDELKEVAKKYGQPRLTEISYTDDLIYEPESEQVQAYDVKLFFTSEGYFKKITPQSWRMSSVHKLKDGDTVVQEIDTQNDCDLLFFTDRCQVYKAKAAQFDDTKASLIGDFIPAKLEMEQGERALYMVPTRDYSGYMLFFFASGKIAKVNLSAYQTKQNRRKLVGAYSDKSPLVAVYWVPEDSEFLLRTSLDRMLIVNSALIAPKQTKNTQGVAGIKLTKNAVLQTVVPLARAELQDEHRYRTKTIPSMGAKIAAEDLASQLTLGQ